MLLSIHACRKFSVYYLLLTLGLLQSNALYSQKTFGLTKKLNGNDENGYVLFSPLNCDTTYLINKCGQKVHQWVSDYTPGMSVYLLPNGHLLKTGTYTDTAFGVAGGRGGIIEEFDWSNNLVWRYRLFNDSLCQHHDIRPMPNGNVLVLAWHSISKTEALGKGRRTETFASGQTQLWGERIIELKPIGRDSADIVWQWDLFDHIIQDVDSTKPNYGVVSQHPERLNLNYALTMQTADWIHANAIDYNPKLDQIILNSHNISEFWIIDHSTTTQEAASHSGGQFDKGGDFLYRWGNPAAYDMGSSSDRKLFRQHNAHWIPGGLLDSGCVMVFNNGWERDTAYSTVEVIQTPVLPNGSYVQNLPFGPSNSKWIYKDSIPTNFYSQIISGAERMPNGNTIICNGLNGIFFEVTPQKKTVWRYKNPTSGTGVKADGSTGANPVFRASFYASNFPAFKNKSLNGYGVLERNPFPYSCLYETVPPKVKSFVPANNSYGIKVDSVLHVTMSEAVLKVNASFTIFVDGKPYESISNASDLVTYTNQEIQIRHVKKFPYNSRISVAIPLKFARDSSFNYTTAGIDTAHWHFNTEKMAPIMTYRSPDSAAVNVSLNPLPYLLYNTKMKKAAGGGFTIYENGLMKEFIPVSSSRIKISGNVVQLLNTTFNYDKTVIITADTCLEDTLGYNINPIAYGSWIFNTVTMPKVDLKNPVTGTQKVRPDVKLQMTFDRYMKVDSQFNANIYANGHLYKSIPMSSSDVQSGGTDLIITVSGGLPENSRISVSLPAYTLRDNFKTWCTGLDSSQWWFNTGSLSSVRSITDNTNQVYPNPFINKLYITTHNSLSQLTLRDVFGKSYIIPLGQESEYTFYAEIEALPSGIYFLDLGDGVPIRVMKL